MAYIKETGRGERDARGSGRVVVVAAGPGQECVSVCVLYEWRKKCMHMVMEETKGKNAPSIRHKGPRATLLPAGWMDGWLALQ
jgi:hypothetical protein